MQRVLDKLKLFYAAMGNAPDTTTALVVMAEALASRADPRAVNLALNRCMVECRFPVRLPDIFARVPGFDVDANAEKRLAWEIVEQFVRDWVEPDMEGNYQALESREACAMADSDLADKYGNAAVAVNRHVVQAPKLSDRILDTVRRTGGWSVYKRLTDESFPHQQKRFFEEYQSWTEIQHVAADPAKVLAMPSRKQLRAESAARPKRVEASAPARTPEPVQLSARLPVKDFYELPTAEELRDRALLAKARLAQYLNQKQQAQEAGR